MHWPTLLCHFHTHPLPLLPTFLFSHLPLIASAHHFLPVQEVAKKRTRRTVKSQRGIVGASLDVIKERRAQRPEARAAARQAAIKEGKEKKTESESKKKAEKAKSAAAGARGQPGRIQSKMGAKGAAPKVQARTK